MAEEYLSILYDHLHEELYSYHVIQADETPVLVNHDGRKAGSKSWMWVYRSGHLYQDRQIVLYEYQQTRNASHPREFLKGYDGICVTDGYQVYHTLEKELEELTIETAIRMLEDCLPVEKIALYSGLSVAEVRELEGKRQ